MPYGGMHGGFHGRGGRYLTEEEKASMPRVTTELLVRIAGHLRPYWRQLLFALVCVTASSILNLYPAILTGRIIDDGLIGRDLPLLVRLILLSLAVTFAANLIGVLFRVPDPGFLVVVKAVKITVFKEAASTDPEAAAEYKRYLDERIEASNRYRMKKVGKTA